MKALSLGLLPGRFAVAHLEPACPLPGWATEARWFSITRTPAELSVIAPERCVPVDASSERGFRVLAVRGPLDFQQTGVLAALVAPLARAGIPILALSSYQSDFLLVREGDLEQAIIALEEAGHRVGGFEEAAD
jgi:uncharacterized protein